MIFKRKKFIKNENFLKSVSEIVGFTVASTEGVLKFLKQGVLSYNSLMDCNCKHCNKILIAAHKFNDDFWENKRKNFKEKFKKFTSSAREEAKPNS